MKPKTVIRLVTLVMLLVARTAAAQDTGSLTNQDVTNLVRSGISNTLLLATIASARRRKTREAAQASSRSGASKK